MTGSSLAPIVIPVVVVIVLAVWLIMVFRADSHPRWGHQAAAGTRPGAGLPREAGQLLDLPLPDAQPDGTAPVSLPSPARLSPASEPRLSPASEPRLPHAA
jgi:hypothetical protein